MPIHDIGYRAWQGEKAFAAGRWWFIAQTGIRLAWKSHWLRRMLFVAWLPAVYLGTALFAYEHFAADQGAAAGATWLLSRLPDSRPFADVLKSGGTLPRRDVWALLLLTLFRYPQGVLMVMLVGIIAPPLIANDMRSRAYLLYFSRPLGTLDYVLGKSFIVWTYLFTITALPALGLYVLGVSLSPDLSVVLDTWDLPLRILGASIWLILPTTAMALCYSSLTNESRYASAAWFATWAMGWLAYTSLSMLDAQLDGDDGISGLINQPRSARRWVLVSLYHSLGRIQSWVFGLEREFTSVLPPIVLIVVLTAVCLAVLARRVTAPLRS